MVNIFVGVDPRQPVAFHVLTSSIIRRSSTPVSVTPLLLPQLPIERRGLTDFTFARYLVPWLCGYEGTGIFMDSDMLVLGDVAELATPREAAVSLVPFEDALKFERPSLMVFNNAKCQALTPQFIDDPMNTPQDLEWAQDGGVGEIGREWNFLVGYDTPSEEPPKLIHYTQGVPGYKECRACDYANTWFNELEAVNFHASWLEVMGSSVHARPVLERLQA